MSELGGACLGAGLGPRGRGLKNAEAVLRAKGLGPALGVAMDHGAGLCGARARGSSLGAGLGARVGLWAEGRAGAGPA